MRQAFSLQMDSAAFTQGVALGWHERRLWRRPGAVMASNTQIFGSERCVEGAARTVARRLRPRQHGVTSRILGIAIGTVQGNLCRAWVLKKNQRPERHNRKGRVCRSIKDEVADQAVDDAAAGADDRT